VACGLGGSVSTVPDVVGGVAATGVLVAARLAFPWPLRGLMEIVFQKSSPGRGGAVLSVVPSAGDPVVWLVGGFAAIILIWGVSEALQRLAFSRYSAGLVRDVQKVALRRLPRAVRSGQGAGDLISTVTSDAGLVKTGLKSILIGISRNSAFFLGVAIIVMVIDPAIGFVFLAGGLATIAAGSVGAWRSSMIIRRSRQREGELTEDLHQFFRGGSTPSSPAAAPKRPEAKASRVEGLTTIAVHVILGASTCAILILTIRGGRAGSLSSGSVFTIVAYILLMHNKTVSLGRSIVRLGRVLPPAERLSRLLRHKPPSSLAKQSRSRDADSDGGGAAEPDDADPPVVELPVPH